MGPVNPTLAAKGLLLTGGTVVDATLIGAPISTTNSNGERDPEMHETTKGNQWHYGNAGAHRVDIEPVLVHAAVASMSLPTKAHRMHLRSVA